MKVPCLGQALGLLVLFTSLKVSSCEAYISAVPISKLTLPLTFFLTYLRQLYLGSI